MSLSETIGQTTRVIFSTILSKVFTLLAAILIARMISPESFGLLDFAVVVFVNVFAVGTLNLNLGISRIIPTLEKKEEMITSGVLLLLMLSLATTAVFFLGQPFFLAFFGYELETAYWLLIVAGGLYAAFTFAQGVSQGIEDFSWYVKTQVVQSGIFFALVMADFFVGLPIGVKENVVSGALVYYIISYAVVNAWAIWRYKRYLVLPKKGFGGKLQELFIRNLKYFSLPVIFSGIILVLNKTIFYSVSPLELGQYRAMDLLSLTLIVPLVSFGVVLMPKLIKRNTKTEEYELLKRIVRLGMISGFVAALLLGITGGWIIQLVFGMKYQLAAQMFHLLSGALFLTAVTSTWSAMIATVQKWQKHWVILTSLQLAVSFGLTLLLVPKLGLMGQIGVLYLSNIIMLVGCFWITRKTWKIQGWVRNGILLLASMIGLVVCGQIARQDPLWGIVAGGALLVAEWIVIRGLNVIPKEDWQWMKTILKEMIRKISAKAKRN